VEVTEESWGDLIPSTSRWSTSTNEGATLHHLKSGLLLREIIETTLINGLS
jgi:hypothetical protein